MTLINALIKDRLEYFDSKKSYKAFAQKMASAKNNYGSLAEAIAKNNKNTKIAKYLRNLRRAKF